MAKTTTPVTPVEPQETGKLSNIEGVKEAQEILEDRLDSRRDEILPPPDDDKLLGDDTVLEAIGRSNRTGYALGETFEFFPMDVYSNWRENKSILVVEHTSRNNRKSNRLYALVNAFYKVGSGKVAEHVKYTDMGNIVKYEYLSEVAPDDKNIVHDDSARRSVIDDASNKDLADLRTPYEILKALAGKKITGTESQSAHLQQRFEGGYPVTGEFISQKVTLPLIEKK